MLRDVLEQLRAFEPVDDNWLPLDGLLADLLTSELPLARALPVLFGVFERFPDHDGYGVMCALLHGIEKIAGYEPELLASVQPRPCEFNLTMIRRIINGGVTRIGDTELKPLLDHFG